MSILVTGGTGYIGSHVCVELLRQGHRVVAVDSLRNSHKQVAEKISELTKKDLIFKQLNLNDSGKVKELFGQNSFSSIIHLAGHKSVGESVMKPLEYYRNNIGITANLCRAMEKHGIEKMVFSSSATVYGIPENCPISESSKLQPLNPYGYSKLACEKLLRRKKRENPSWKIALLRYFNPVGADASGLIGEDPTDAPNNLMPKIMHTLTGNEKLKIFGNDYATKDGTAVRDYIHVSDLAKGHICALARLENEGLIICNLGTGKGYSVLEVINTFEKVNKIKIPHSFAPRREGDAPVCYADTTVAGRLINWKAEKGLDLMCKDAWRWWQNRSSEQN